MLYEVPIYQRQDVTVLYFHLVNKGMFKRLETILVFDWTARQAKMSMVKQ